MTRTGATPIHPRRRALHPAALTWLVLLASWSLFYRLGAPDLRGDEAIWAGSLDFMTADNAWMGLMPWGRLSE